MNDEANTESGETSVTVGSGNVFADLGLPDADTLYAKALLAIEIQQAIESRGLTQQQAAKALGIDPSEISAIVRGHLDDLSTDRLLHFLNELGCDVEIRVSSPHPEARGKLVCA